jgi:hypothetical protein
LIKNFRLGQIWAVLKLVVQKPDDARPVRLRDMGVLLNHGQTAPPAQFLDGHQIGSAAYQLRGKGVP